MSHTLKALRVYDLKDETPGCRVLVDRLWPRGLRKEALRLDRWAREITPSPELRKWFGHAQERFDTFEALYRAELDGSEEARAFARDMAEILEKQDVLLLFAAKSPACNHAVILRDWLTEQLEGGRLVDDTDSL